MAQLLLSSTLTLVEGLDHVIGQGTALFIIIVHCLIIQPPHVLLLRVPISTRLAMRNVGGTAGVDGCQIRLSALVEMMGTLSLMTPSASW